MRTTPMQRKDIDYSVSNTNGEGMESTKDKEIINIVLTGDKNYVEPMTVTMTSILSNLKKEYIAHFFLFTDDYPPEKQKIIRLLENSYNCIIDFVNVLPHMYLFEDTDMDKFNNKYISMACYYRLLLFKLLPDDVQIVFYVDGDMIVDTDLSEIIPLLDNKIAAAVVESFAMENREQVLSHLGKYQEFKNFNECPEKYPYFNAGFLGLNMSFCKKEKIWEKIYGLYKKEKNFPFADQDMLNAIIGQQYTDRIEFLPPEYNVFCARSLNHNQIYRRAYYPSGAITNAFNHPKIYHYAGPEKPWSYPICNYYEKWWEYAIKSPVCDSLLLEVSMRWRIELERHIDTLNKLNANNNALKRRFYQYFNKCKQYAYEKLTKKGDVRTRYSDYSSNIGAGPINLIKKTVMLLYFNIHREQEPCPIKVEKNKINHKRLQQIIKKSDIVSFDIFDTLICRAFIEPNDLLRYVGAQHGDKQFFEKRIAAADQAMRESIKEDVVLEDIYRRMQPPYANSEKDEIDAELQFCYKNDLINEIYEFAKENNKRIIYTSDMYLPHNLIIEMLKKCGYEPDNTLFLSSDYGLLKRTGSLFDAVIEQTGADPKTIIHIGDSELGDYTIPREKKMNAYRIPTRKQILFRESPCINIYCQSNNDLSSSVIMGIVAEELTKNKDYWNKIGVKLAGPIILSYSTWLIKQLRKDNIKDVYFVARDGYLIEKTFEMLAPGEFRTHYLYAPRRVSNICNLDFDLKLSYGDWAAEFVDSVYQNYLTDLKLDTQWDKISTKERGEIIEKNMDRIRKISATKKQQYRDYLVSFEMKDTIAIIDTTTTFFSTQKMINNVIPEINVIGYYWVTAYNDSVDKTIDSEHQRSFVNGHTNHIIDWDIMEFIFTSPEYPVLDVTSEGQPVFKEPNKDDLLRSSVFQKISKGAVDFISSFKQHGFDYNLIQMTGEQLEDYVNIWMNNPTKEDKEQFKDMRLPVRCEHDLYVPVFKPWYK